MSERDKPDRDKAPEPRRPPPPPPPPPREKPDDDREIRESDLPLSDDLPGDTGEEY